MHVWRQNDLSIAFRMLDAVLREYDSFDPFSSHQTLILVVLHTLPAGNLKTRLVLNSRFVLDEEGWTIYIQDHWRCTLFYDGLVEMQYGFQSVHWEVLDEFEPTIG